MHKLMNIIVVVLVIAISGSLRMNFDQSLSSDLKQAKILAPSFDRESYASLSQKGLIASFGSLRPILAAFTTLSSTKYQWQGDWDNLENSIDKMVLLDPYNSYYWDFGGWQLAYNASDAFLENMDIPPLKRKQLFKRYIEMGDQLYARGIASNPDNIQLRLERARLWTNPHKIPDYSKVVEILQDTIKSCKMSSAELNIFRLRLFYAMMHIPAYYDQAYALGRTLYAEPFNNRQISLINGLCALQLHPKFKGKDPLTMSQLYSNRKNAIEYLGNYLKDNDNQKPRYGIENLIDKMRAVD